MTERAGVGTRRTRMKRSIVLCALSLALLSGCGDEGTRSTPETNPGKTPSSTVTPDLSDCATPGTSDSKQISTDLDGDGTPEDLVLTGPTDGCGWVLGVSSDGLRGVKLDTDLEPDPKSLVDLEIGTGGDHVYLLRSSHPRGGYEVRLFNVSTSGVTELTIDGGPVIPFVATDAPTQYVVAACTPGGFELTRAVARRPGGAWDIARTSYTLDGSTVTTGTTTQLAGAVPDKAFATRYPALAQGGGAFTNCPPA